MAVAREPFLPHAIHMPQTAQIVNIFFAEGQAEGGPNSRRWPVLSRNLAPGARGRAVTRAPGSRSHPVSRRRAWPDKAQYDKTRINPRYW